MFNNLELSKNAQFYKLKRGLALTDNNVERIMIKACSNRKGGNYIGEMYLRQNRDIEDVGSYKYSLRVYPSGKKVSFIKDIELYDLIHSYILFIEFDDYVVIFKKSTASFGPELLKYMIPFGFNDIMNVFNVEEVDIQRMSLRNMTISSQAIHSHSYETPGSLDGMISPHASGRAIPKNLRFKENNTMKSVTSSTARIIESSEKQNIDQCFFWAKSQILKMNNPDINPLINKYAKPESLEDTLFVTQPSALLIESSLIIDAIMSDELILGVAGSRFKKLPISIRDKVIEFLQNMFEVRGTYDLISRLSNNEKLYYEDNGTLLEIGQLNRNEKSLTFIITLFTRIKVSVNGRLPQTLNQYIINNKYFSIVFNDYRYMYFMGECFKDNSSVSEIDSILNSLEDYASINSVTNEKGSMLPATKEDFDQTSMFAVVEDIHANDDYIFCDDLLDEWCDHITINSTDNIINFIHSKASSNSLGASKMHDVVGQGIKNLGNMFFTIDGFKSIKQSKFESTYNNDNQRTSIKRIRKGNSPMTQTDLNVIENVLNNPRTHRQCILSCSFLSKDQLSAEFDNIRKGNYVQGHILQMYWILSSFIHACKGVNVIPKVYCKP